MISIATLDWQVYPNSPGGSGQAAADYYLSNFRLSTPFSPGKGINDGWHASGHNGIDLAGKSGPGSAMGAKIPALMGGTVSQVFVNNKTAGNGVVIKGSDGREYRYIHMKNAPALKVGQKVSPGMNLGFVGSTGRSSGAHLDLKIKENGRYIDPYKFIQGMKGNPSNNRVPLGKMKDIAGVSQSTPGRTYSNTWKTKQQALKSPTYQAYKQHLAAALETGQVRSDWVVGLTELIGRESSWKPTADNPRSTAWGYGQFLDSTRKAYQKKFPNLNYNNPVHQIILTAAYVKDRYGTIDKALQFWDKNNWY